MRWRLAVTPLVVGSLFAMAGLGGAEPFRPVARSDFELDLTVPAGAVPYMALLNGPDGHLTCPFDYRSAREVTVFLGDGSEASEAPSFAGMTGVSRHPVTDARRSFATCSDVLSGSRKAQLARVDAYLWVPLRPTLQLSDEQQEVQDVANRTIALSGLPILDGLGSNVAICFEENSTTKEPPSYWLTMVGVGVPEWAVEQRVPGTSCEDAIVGYMQTLPRGPG
jgi:hypothetical protein